jgi:hypothetical protein
MNGIRYLNLKFLLPKVIPDVTELLTTIVEVL